MKLVRDEREREIDLRAQRAAYAVVSYGLLVLVMYRAAARNEASWDLLGLAILGGAVNVGYTAWKRAASRQMLYLGLSIGILSALVAALVAWATHLV